MYKIGVFSKMNRITVKALRHYDEIGLFKPSHVDEITGYRYYSSSQLPQLHKILALKRIGFSLDEIQHAVEQESDGNNLISYLEEKQVEIARIIEGEQMQLTHIQWYLKILKQGGVYFQKYLTKFSICNTLPI
jgi:DNA-binding transcriptional MerR regulator